MNRTQRASRSSAPPESIALVARLAGIPWRLGYSRDGRGLLLTDRLEALRRRDVDPFRRSATDPGAWAPVPACEYYNRLVAHFCASIEAEAPAPGAMELGVTEAEELEQRRILAGAGIEPGDPYVVLNPGANNPAKRWPAERFALLADHLSRRTKCASSSTPGRASTRSPGPFSRPAPPGRTRSRSTNTR